MAISLENFVQKLSEKFPNICSNYKVVSGPHMGAGYNCLAFALDDTLRWWWPTGEDAYWPEGLPKDERLETFIQCFKKHGFLSCGLDERLEVGYEKIAIYVDCDGVPTHFSKQLPGDNGWWRSKLSDKALIKHKLGGISGFFSENICENYGNIRVIMKRPVNIQLVSVIESL